MKTFTFDHEPTFAELWDVCVYNLIYKVEDYKKDIEGLFKKIGISKESNIIDVSAGGGFPAIELVEEGYKIICLDGFEDEVELFNRKAKERALQVRCTKAMWKDLPSLFVRDTVDFLFCRGNSFIYAAGGWNSMMDIDASKSAQNYKDTLSTFHNLLKPGAWIYLDKFKDTETTHRETVCTIRVSDHAPEELIFWTERFPEQKIRQASMIRKKGDAEVKVPNITYDLSSKELESFLTETGFKNIQKLELPSEQHFDAWLAQK